MCVCVCIMQREVCLRVLNVCVRECVCVCVVVLVVVGGGGGVRKQL
jgi:hypothetical protein